MKPPLAIDISRERAYDKPQIVKGASAMSLPNDPMILLSYVNTQLRDFHSSLDDFCKSMQVDAGELQQKLAGIGYEYDAELNRFV